MVGSCFSNIRAITHLARKQKFLVEDSGEDVTMPLTKPVEKPVMSVEQILSLLWTITDLHDLPNARQNLQRNPRQRGHGVSVEVLEARFPDTIRHRLRGAVLEGTAQVEGEPDADSQFPNRFVR